MGSVVKAQTLRSAIAGAVAQLKSYNVPAVCERLGLAPGTEEEAFASKARYVTGRLQNLSLTDLVRVAQRFVEDYDDAELEAVLGSMGPRGVDGSFKNLIFAADGPKPKIVLRDAVDNILEIVENGEHCLVYDRPLGPDGLTLRALADWWRSRQPDRAGDEDAEAARHLHKRLRASLDSPPERVLFDAYGTFYPQPGGLDLPALIPQVYLHYDPYVRRPSRPGLLARQRMDFLLLLPGRERIVIEVDGAQHYSRPSAAVPSGTPFADIKVEDRVPDPAAYAAMVAEDRRLRLAGYEVFRFGGHELCGPRGHAAALDFFTALRNRSKARAG
ncbi:hypothetical protein [Kitasatospora paranensis]|uniref:AbiJ-NTD3 domain-containing protein n=1 Tax=Kitasatospora paranensis TaxID=258053 RepID=A0ABW2G0V2_9ACTN